ncbi:MAG: hypothetical protein P0Y58_06520 [Candidatus Pseudomonas phytovorans]|uniref:Uncharacterized protein n=1 Tax=Candidatus Pseudomonas phytovorans TaxID=3121377 RepID=A0AAJ5WLL8_9PSED|nr:hypothetical protein [Pseudomonas sp.]WEK31847.1 MAG: hypothetical protein P0Y58_06520 [Pseudomonas sp.]
MDMFVLAPVVDPFFSGLGVFKFLLAVFGHGEAPFHFFMSYGLMHLVLWFLLGVTPLLHAAGVTLGYFIPVPGG